MTYKNATLKEIAQALLDLSKSYPINLLDRKVVVAFYKDANEANPRAFFTFFTLASRTNKKELNLLSVSIEDFDALNDFGFFDVMLWSHPTDGDNHTYHLKELRKVEEAFKKVNDFLYRKYGKESISKKLKEIK